MLLTLKELVDYCLINRKNKVFRGYSEEEIAIGILNASNKGTLLYCVNERCELTGIVIGEIVEDKMHVRNILTTDRNAIKAFVKEFKTLWPNLTLTAIRKGFPVTYNTTKLCNKLQ